MWAQTYAVYYNVLNLQLLNLKDLRKKSPREPIWVCCMTFYFSLATICSSGNSSKDFQRHGWVDLIPEFDSSPRGVVWKNSPGSRVSTRSRCTAHHSKTYANSKR